MERADSLLLVRFNDFSNLFVGKEFLFVTRSKEKLYCLRLECYMRTTAVGRYLREFCYSYLELGFQRL